MRLLAIGDIHGSSEKLETLIGKIDPRRDDQLVFLGDYIDRGPNSCEVIEFLVNFQENFPKTVCLRGNHEWLMLDALWEAGIDTGTPLLNSCSSLWHRETAWMPTSEDKNILLWLHNHGYATLKSYGIFLKRDHKGLRLDDYRRAFEPIPAKHIEFLASTQLCYEKGDFLFVHAGVNASKSLEEQDPYHLLWSREGFWQYCAGWNRCVVHGHTPVSSPQISKFEIALDTGAVAGGELTACDVYTGHLWQA
ncbi:MAG: metallophosphoesterase family protein [Syntrophotaleaceae bacterium]